jgi:hypothetical protein
MIAMDYDSDNMKTNQLRVPHPRDAFVFVARVGYLNTPSKG